MLTLNIKNREKVGNLESIRKMNLMPAVFYGPKEKSTNISVDLKEFTKVWKKAGESSVIILKDEKGNEHESLIHDVNVHAVSGVPLHADFYVIEKGKKVEVSVPLVFSGIAPAVKDLGGILVRVHRELKIEATPRDLPHELTVDIAKLATLTDVIHAGDISLPKGVELKVDANEVIASIAEAKEEVVEAPAAIDMSTIEVEAKGKEVKEGEAGEAKPDAKVESKKPEAKK
jgi:large subunit ribosomal protein L25